MDCRLQYATEDRYSGRCLPRTRKESGITVDEFKDVVIIAATNNWDGVRMADRQLAEHLAKRVPVLYVDPATSAVTRYRREGISGIRAGNGVTHIGRGLARLTPNGLPGLERRGIAQINSRLIARQARVAVARLHGTVLATIDANILTPIMGRCGERVKVYWAQDDWEGLAPLVGTDPAAFAAAEQMASSRADIIIAANPNVAGKLASHGYNPHLIPFGCDYELFATTTTTPPAPDVTLKSPIAAFMGHLGDRIDLGIFERVASSEVSLLLVGPVHPRTDPERFQAIVNRPNVQWVGERPFEDLPRYLAHAQVGLLPYTHSKFNLGSFPLKTLEYLAAGMPVVATSLPAIEWLDAPQISTRDQPDEFVEEVRRLLALGKTGRTTEACQRFAIQHSWSQRADAFIKAMGL